MKTIQGDTTPRSGARTVAIVGGFLGGLGWIAKIIVMAAQRGPDPDSAAEAIAFFAGLAGIGVASAATGAYFARRASTPRRILAAAGGVVALGVVIGLAQAALPALFGDGWVQDEAIFGAVGLIAIISASLALRSPAATTAQRRRPARRPPRAA